MTRDNAKISILFIISNICVVAYYTYLAQILETFGFSPQQIGTLLMISVIMAVVSMPLMGYLTDNYISDKAMMVINLTVAIIGSLFFWNVEKTFLNFALIIGVWSFFLKPITNVVETYAYKLINAGYPIDYGVVRSMGSFGFAVFAYISGVIIDHTSFRSLYFIQILAALSLMISAIFIFKKEDKKSETKEEVLGAEKITNEKKQSAVDIVKLLVKNRDYLALIFGGFFINLSVSLHFTYVPLLLQQNGASPGNVGTAFSIMALSEIPTIALFSKIKTRVNPSTLIVIGGIAYIFRMVAVVQYPTVEMFWLMGVLQMVSFGFLSPSYMYIINRVVPKEIASTATLTAITFIFNLSSVFALYFGGYYIEQYGYELVLSFGWILCLIGTSIFILNYKIIKNKNRKAGI